MKIEIELTEKQIEMLGQYAQLYKEERSLDHTTDPIVVVEKRDFVIAEEGYEDEYVYLVEGDSSVYGTLESLRKVYQEELGDISDDGIENMVPYSNFYRFNDVYIGRFGVSYQWKPVAYFLTRKEANEYRKYQSHNLGISRTYTQNIGYNNYGDLNTVLPLLLSIGEKILMEKAE